MEKQWHLVAAIRELQRLKWLVNGPIDRHIGDAPEFYASSQIFGRQPSDAAAVKPDCLPTLIKAIYRSQWMSSACHAPIMSPAWLGPVDHTLSREPYSGAGPDERTFSDCLAKLAPPDRDLLLGGVKDGMGSKHRRSLRMWASRWSPQAALRSPVSSQQ